MMTLATYAARGFSLSVLGFALWLALNSYRGGAR